MDGSYLIIVYLLLGLAILDLMVGVSNDAVNFLNSAFGSKVATRRTVLIIASLGILVGALFSSGLMEVARKGIFHPEMFTFADIVVIFVAVMLADVLLLDLFNTFGMPTSTTVSIVFELLGAAVAVAIFAVVSQDGSLQQVSEYINGDRAILIISGIVMSVGIAFAVGAAVQFLSRLVFTFQGGREYGITSLIWSALAITVMFFFIMLKGLKGASFLDKATIVQLTSNPWPAAISVFIGCIIIGAFVQYQLRYNLLKIVVLVGTFSLALAFASNDLVNFIGVPLAGLTSYESWASSGVSPSEFSMEALAKPVQGQSGLLIIAGAIMVVTLWLSEKARSVTETEINLGRQEEGNERFEPHTLSRVIVRSFLYISKAFMWMFPRRTTLWVEQRYARPIEGVQSSNPDAAAFDLVRASINLTVASILIAIATTMKLPLSTTYVTFMVAMGTSLADRSWGRDSAVYRVAGVLNVVGGWFATAAMAFTVAAVYAIFIKWLGGFAIAVLVAVAAFALYHTHKLHNNRRQSKIMVDQVDLWNLKTTVEQVAQVIRSAFNGLIKDERAAFADTKARTKALWAHLQEVEVQLVNHLRQTTTPGLNGTRSRLDLYTIEQDLYQSAHLISKSCKDYVRNAHSPLHENQRQKLGELMTSFNNYVHYCLSDSKDDELIDTRSFKHELELALADQVDGLRAGHYSRRNTRLLLGLYLELQDVMQSLDKMQRMRANVKNNAEAAALKAPAPENVAENNATSSNTNEQAPVSMPAPDKTKVAESSGPATPKPTNQATGKPANQTTGTNDDLSSGSGTPDPNTA